MIEKDPRQIDLEDAIAANVQKKRGRKPKAKPLAAAPDAVIKSDVIAHAPDAKPIGTASCVVDGNALTITSNLNASPDHSVGDNKMIAEAKVAISAAADASVEAVSAASAKVDPMTMATLLAGYQQARAALLEAHPDLVDDRDTLADTLEGCTDIDGAITAMVKRVLFIEKGELIGLKSIIDAYQRKQAQLRKEAETLRGQIHLAMTRCDIEKNGTTGARARLQQPQPKLQLLDGVSGDTLPDTLRRTTHAPDMVAIRKLIDAGDKQVKAFARLIPAEDLEKTLVITL